MCSRCYEGPELKEILQLRRNVDSLQQQTRSGSFLGRTWQGQGRLSPRLAHELAKKSGSGKLKALRSVRSPWRRCQGKVLHVTRSLCSMVPTGSFAETIGFKAGTLRLLRLSILVASWLFRSLRWGSLRHRREPSSSLCQPPNVPQCS